MKINLKRALKLRKELETLLNKLELPFATSFSLLIKANQDDPLRAIIPAQAALDEKVNDHLRLSAILANLRVAIADSNVKAGVEDMLAQAAHVERSLALYRRIVEAPLMQAPEVIVAETAMAVKELNEPSTDRYARPSRDIKTAIVTPGMRNAASGMIITLKRRKQEIEDRRTAANASVQIEIPEDDAEILTSLGVL